MRLITMSNLQIRVVSLLLVSSILWSTADFAVAAQTNQGRLRIHSINDAPLSETQALAPEHILNYFSRRLLSKTPQFALLREERHALAVGFAASATTIGGIRPFFAGANHPFIRPLVDFLRTIIRPVIWVVALTVVSLISLPSPPRDGKLHPNPFDGRLTKASHSFSIMRLQQIGWRILSPSSQGYFEIPKGAQEVRISVDRSVGVPYGVALTWDWSAWNGDMMKESTGISGSPTPARRIRRIPAGTQVVYRLPVKLLGPSEIDVSTGRALEERHTAANKTRVEYSAETDSDLEPEDIIVGEASTLTLSDQISILPSGPRTTSLSLLLELDPELKENPPSVTASVFSSDGEVVTWPMSFAGRYRLTSARGAPITKVQLSPLTSSATLPIKDLLWGTEPTSAFEPTSETKPLDLYRPGPVVRFRLWFAAATVLALFSRFFKLRKVTSRDQAFELNLPSKNGSLDRSLRSFRLSFQVALWAFLIVGVCAFANMNWRAFGGMSSWRSQAVDFLHFYQGPKVFFDSLAHTGGFTELWRPGVFHWAVQNGIIGLEGYRERLFDAIYDAQFAGWTAIPENLLLLRPISFLKYPVALALWRSLQAGGLLAMILPWFIRLRPDWTRRRSVLTALAVALGASAIGYINLFADFWMGNTGLITGGLLALAIFTFLYTENATTSRRGKLITLTALLTAAGFILKIYPLIVMGGLWLLSLWETSGPTFVRRFRRWLTSPAATSVAATTAAVAASAIILEGIAPGIHATWWHSFSSFIADKGIHEGLARNPVLTSWLDFLFHGLPEAKTKISAWPGLIDKIGNLLIGAAKIPPLVFSLGLGGIALAGRRIATGPIKQMLQAAALIAWLPSMLTHMWFIYFAVLAIPLLIAGLSLPHVANSRARWLLGGTLILSLLMLVTHIHPALSLPGNGVHEAYMLIGETISTHGPMVGHDSFIGEIANGRYSAPLAVASGYLGSLLLYLTSIGILHHLDNSNVRQDHRIPGSA